jgi:hypothetical protein
MSDFHPSFVDIIQQSLYPQCYVRRINSVQESFKYETERQKIEHHGKWLKDSIDRNIHKLLCDLDMSWKVLNKSISDEENNLVQNGKELEGMNENPIDRIFQPFTMMFNFLPFRFIFKTFLCS